MWRAAKDGLCGRVLQCAGHLHQHCKEARGDVLMSGSPHQPFSEHMDDVSVHSVQKKLNEKLFHVFSLLISESLGNRKW